MAVLKVSNKVGELAVQLEISVAARKEIFWVEEKAAWLEFSAES